MQAILTKYLGATNHRGSRYKATCEAGSVTLHGDHALNSEDNHVRVAKALITKLGWWHDEARGDRYGGWTFGGTPEGYAFVCGVSWARVEKPPYLEMPAAALAPVLDPSCSGHFHATTELCTECGKTADEHDLGDGSGDE